MQKDHPKNGAAATPQTDQDLGSNPATDPPAADPKAKGAANAPKATAKTPPAAELDVIVVGPKSGRWRAGRHFTNVPVTIPATALSADELAALRADPMLIVSTKPQSQE